MQNPKIGFILLGHGTKCSEGREEFLFLFNNLCRTNPNLPLTYAFLEYAEPNADSAIHAFIQTGITEIYVLPLFLFQGVHIKNDIPGLIKKLHFKYKINIRLLDYFGVCDELIELSSNIIKKTQAKQPFPTKKDTILIIAGVGSSIQQGNEEFREMAQKIIEKTGYENSHIGFLSKVASPKIESIVAAFQYGHMYTTIIHPLLFFHGMYTKQLQKMIILQSQLNNLNASITDTYGSGPELLKVIQVKINAVCTQLRDNHQNDIQRHDTKAKKNKRKAHKEHS